MNGPAVAAIKARWTFSSKFAIKHEKTITSYADGVNHLLSSCANDAVIASVDEEIRNFKQGSITPWDFSEKLCNLTLGCDFVYKKQMLRRFFVEDIDLSIRSAMQR